MVKLRPPQQRQRIHQRHCCCPSRSPRTHRATRLHCLPRRSPAVRALAPAASSWTSPVLGCDCVAPSITGDEIRAIRRQYSINQAQAAAIFGGGPVAFSKYENDDVAHSAAMDKLLRLATESADAFRRLVMQAGMADELPQPAPQAIVWSATTSVTNGASNDDAFLRASRAPVEQGTRVRYELVGGR
ncbi:MAG: type II toxin-antitoxin system MqsA family antitoxin [Paucibacter sp.]|nr:type II toxin-antitoxin system MqsA family antitoxin [Roseateles sp.]